MQEHGFPSIGVALPCNEMAIHDANGMPVPDGERGEIVARGTNVMRGYDNNEKANTEAFAHGWFRSGDEGFRLLDASGRAFYFITGRLKELIIRGGVNLAPLEIDEVINRAPGVKAGICVGFENTMYGEEVGALVIAEEGAAQADAILAFCRAHLPFHKCPKVVLFTDALPVTSTGKYQRSKVKHLFAEWKNAQFRK
jgi:long-chain acyl-CoA synthetase